VPVFAEASAAIGPAKIEATPLAVRDAVVGRAPLAAEQIANDRGEEREDLAPGEKAEPGEHDEVDGPVDQVQEQEDRESFQHEGDEHRVLAADVVRHPAAERARDAVEHRRRRR